MSLIYKFIAVAVVGAFLGSGLTFVIINRTSVNMGAAATSAARDSGFKAKTYTYYHAHPAEAEKRWHECNDIGISPMADTPESRDCNSAGQARP
jgi:hypothetical protein